MNMARFRSQIQPGSNPYSRTKIGYGMIQSSSQTFESYVAKSSEQKVEFHGVIDDHIIHSPRKEVHGLVGPIISQRDSPHERADKLIPQVHHGRDNSSPTRKHYVVTHSDGEKLKPWNSVPNHLEKVEGFSPKARHEDVNIPNKDSPRNNQYNSPRGKDHDDFGKCQIGVKERPNYLNEEMMSHSPPAARKDTRYEKVEGFSPKARHEDVNIPNKDSPRNNQYNSPRSKDHDDFGKRQVGVKEKPNYLNEEMMSPSPPAARKDRHYEKSSFYNDDENILKGAGLAQPKKDTHYEIWPNNMVIMNPPPIKTRIDRGSSSGKDKEFSNGSGKNSPVTFATNYSSPTRKEYHYHQDNVFDHSEYHRRYARVSQQGAAGGFAEDYVGTIDSDEAARKYHGLLLSS